MLKIIVFTCRCMSRWEKPSVAKALCNGFWLDSFPGIVEKINCLLDVDVLHFTSTVHRINVASTTKHSTGKTKVSL